MKLDLPSGMILMLDYKILSIKKSPIELVNSMKFFYKKLYKSTNIGKEILLGNKKCTV